MSEISKHDQEEPQEPEDKKVQVVPVEQLIPGIKPASEIKKLEGVGYGTNKFGDSFVPGFLNQEMGIIFSSKKYEGPFAGFKKDLDVLRERMKDQIVVDLGSGTSRPGYILASLLGAKGYVGVDQFQKGDLSNLTEKEIRSALKETFSRDSTPADAGEVEQKIEKHIKPEAISASVIKGDMLDFLRRLPDNSVSIFTFGISGEIIIDGKYGKALGEEINRVLNSEGGYLKLESAIPVEGVKNLFQELSDKELEDRVGEPEYSISPWLISGNPGFFVKK